MHFIHYILLRTIYCTFLFFEIVVLSEIWLILGLVFSKFDFVLVFLGAILMKFPLFSFELLMLRGKGNSLVSWILLFEKFPSSSNDKGLILLSVNFQQKLLASNNLGFESSNWQAKVSNCEGLGIWINPFIIDTLCFK